MRNKKEAPGTCPEQVTLRAWTRSGCYLMKCHSWCHEHWIQGGDLGRTEPAAGQTPPLTVPGSRAAALGEMPQSSFPTLFPPKSEMTLSHFLLKNPVCLGRELHQWLDKDIYWLFECLQWGSICARCMKTGVWLWRFPAQDFSVPEETAGVRPEGHLGAEKWSWLFYKLIGVTGGSLVSQNELEAPERCLLTKIKL